MDPLTTVGGFYNAKMKGGMALANESIGKISLDMEIQADLDRQIKEAADNIGKQIENALSKSGINTQMAKLFDTLTKVLNNNLKRTMDNLSKQIDLLLRKMTQVKPPAIKAPTKVSVPPNMVTDSTASRAPPIAAPKAKSGFNADVIKSQMETIEKEMDFLESKIGGQTSKLSELRQQYELTFNGQKKNKIQEQIFKTENSLVQLMKKMDTLGLKYTALEEKLSSFAASNANVFRSLNGFRVTIPTSNIAPAVSQVSNLRAALGRTAEGAAKVSSPLQNMGRLLKQTFSLNGVKDIGKAFAGLPAKINASTKSLSGLIPKIHLFNKATKTAKSSNDYFKNGLGGTLKQMFKWMIILPLIVKGINAMAQSLYQSLMTNEQFSSSLAQIKTNLMVAFTPIYQAILPAINTLMSALSKATAYVASFISQLFGKTYQQSFNATQGLVSAKDAMGAYGTSTKSATKAAEKFNRTIAGFDKIEKLNSDTDSGDSGDAESSAPVLVQPSIDTSVLDATTIPWVEKFKSILAKIFDPFKEAWAAEGQNTIVSMKTALENVWQLVKDIGKSFLEVWTNGTGALMLTNMLQIFQGIFDLIGNIAAGLDEAWNKNGTGTAIVQALFDIFNTILGTIKEIIGATAEWAGKLDFSPLLNSVKTLLEAIAPFTKTVGDGLAWFWENVLLPIAGWAIQTAVPTFLDMLSAALDALNEILVALQPLGQWLFDNLLKPLGEWAGGVFIDAMKLVTDLLKKFSDWCSEHQTTVQNIALAIGTFIAVITVGKVVSGIMTFVSSIGGISGALTTLGGGIATIVSALGGPLTLAIGAIIAIGVLLWKNWDTVCAKAKEIWGAICDWFESVCSAIGDFFSGLWKGITNTFKSVGGWFKEKFTAAKDGVQGAFKSIGSWFGDRWSDIKGAMGSAGNWFKNLFETSCQNTKTAWSTIGGWFGDRWSDIKSGMGGVGNWFKDKFTGAMEDSKKAWSNAGTVFGGIWKNIKGAFGNISDWFGDKFSAAWEAVKNVFSKGGEIFSGIKDGILDGLKAVINGLIDGINTVVSIPFSGINSALDGLRDIEILGAKPFGWLPSIGTPQIPRLAQGGFVERNTPQLAMIGDNKRYGEIVAPEDKMQEMVDLAVKSAKPGITREELESIINNAVMRVIAALSAVGFNLDGEQVATLQRMAQTGIDRRYNTVNVTV